MVHCKLVLFTLASRGSVWAPFLCRLVLRASRSLIEGRSCVLHRCVLYPQRRLHFERLRSRSLRRVHRPTPDARIIRCCRAPRIFQTLGVSVFGCRRWCVYPELGYARGQVAFSLKPSSGVALAIFASSHIVGCCGRRRQAMDLANTLRNERRRRRCKVMCQGWQHRPIGLVWEGSALVSEIAEACRSSLVIRGCLYRPKTYSSRSAHKPCDKKPKAELQSSAEVYDHPSELRTPLEGATSAELFRSLQVSHRRRNTTKSGQNRSESL